jgi:cell fate (sporulation/competence/biofilm development) regulator YlbF (YheA/YmcA/DUF963 family)
MGYTQLSLDNNIINCLDDIVKEFEDSLEFIEYTKLKREIENKYYKEILSFTLAKSKLDDAKRYNLDLTNYKKELVLAKEKLYSIDMVKRYLELEHMLQQELDNISNDIASYYSNKFKKKRVI